MKFQESGYFEEKEQHKIKAKNSVLKHRYGYKVDDWKAINFSVITK